MTPDSGKRPSPSADPAAMADRIKHLARQGDFKQAEELRQELMAAEPMALTHIVAAAEVIEEEKTRHLDSDHLAVWSGLYERLSPEETNCLFYTTVPATVAPGKLLLSQGKQNSRLFLIDSGRVTVFFRKEEGNIPIIQLGRGDILGEDTFFGISLCTFSAATQAPVSLRHLSRQDAQRWHDEFPGLLSKLGDYCSKQGKAEIAAAQQKVERRKYYRHQVAAVATAYLVDNQGQRTANYFRGAVSDISRSGICFSMKCSKQETARALLGRNLELSIVFDDLQDKMFRVYGVIVKLSFHLHNDYSVHVRFGETLKQEVFDAFPGDYSDG